MYGNSKLRIQNRINVDGAEYATTCDQKIEDKALLPCCVICIQITLLENAQ
jgi:hypothetical protein